MQILDICWFVMCNDQCINTIDVSHAYTCIIHTNRCTDLFSWKHYIYIIFILYHWGSRLKNHFISNRLSFVLYRLVKLSNLLVGCVFGNYTLHIIANYSWDTYRHTWAVSNVLSHIFDFNIKFLILLNFDPLESLILRWLTFFSLAFLTLWIEIILTIQLKTSWKKTTKIVEDNVALKFVLEI